MVARGIERFQENVGYGSFLALCDWRGSPIDTTKYKIRFIIIDFYI